MIDKGVFIYIVYMVFDEFCEGSLKVVVFNEFKFLVFIDDYLFYFKGVDGFIMKVLIDCNRECFNNFNMGLDR